MRIFTFSLWLAIGISISACGTSQNDSRETDPDDTVTDEPSDTETETDTETENEPSTESDEMESDTSPIIELDTDYETDPTLVPLNGVCPAEKRLGGFAVVMDDRFEPGYSFVNGDVTDIPNPPEIPEVAYEAGDCRLLRAPRLVCDPACEAGQVCGLDETCISAPAEQDLGTVAVQGLVETVIMTPMHPGNSYFYTTLPHPGFETNRVIRLTSTDGFMGEMELFGVGVPPLEAMDDAVVFAENTPLALRWSAPEADARSFLHVEINIDVHGGSPVNLVCDFPDTGEATIPAETVDAFIQAGVTGFPSGAVERRTADEMETEDGCADFIVRSQRTLNIEVTGYIPCTRDEDCTPPETCNTDIEQCG